MASSFEATATHETFSEKEKHAIEAQLERLLANPHFSNSRRFPSFLRYIVNATINGQADLLKERTLGIEIFGKDPDYDTAIEPIVRVTAAEIRKRIAQYYQDSGHEDELRISLAPGSYVPQFHPPATKLPDLEVESAVDAASIVSPAASHQESPARANSRGRWIFAIAMFVVLLGIAAFIGWRYTQRSAFTEFW
jgi:hypothetical protein